MQTLSEMESAKDKNYLDGHIASERESLLVLSEKESDEDPEETEWAKVNMERVSNELDGENPLKTFIDSFKQKYNISVEQNDIAIFV